MTSRFPYKNRGISRHGLSVESYKAERRLVADYRHDLESWRLATPSWAKDVHLQLHPTPGRAFSALQVPWFTFFGSLVYWAIKDRAQSKGKRR